MSFQLVRRILFRPAIYRYGHNYQNRSLCSVPPDNAPGSKDPPGDKKELDLKKVQECKVQHSSKPSEHLENTVELQQKTEASVGEQGNESKQVEEIKLDTRQISESSLCQQGNELGKLGKTELESQQIHEASVEQHVSESKKFEVKIEAQQSLEPSVEQHICKSKKLEEVKTEAQQSPKPSVEQMNVEAQHNIEPSVEEQANKSEKPEESKVEALQNVKPPVEQTDTIPTQNVKDEKRAAAKKKLNDLLISLATTDPVPIEPISRIQLSRPKARPKPAKKEKEEIKAKDAVSASGPSMETQIEPELVEAARDVAESLGGDVKTTESELLSTLRSHAAESSLEEKQSIDLSELFVGMKVERSKSMPMVERQQYGRYDRDPSTPLQRSVEEESQYRRSWSSQQSRSRDPINVDLVNGKKLGIFDLAKLEKIKSGDEGSIIGESVLRVWEAVHQRELQLSITHPAINAFVEMIQWTKQGKLWTFPIDNEIGLEAEKLVGFHEHIFLEHHLEGWCPRRGPVRHFMELVCTGLSKNPHLTVERKKRHIMWYKNYFESKQETLKEVGVI